MEKALVPGLQGWAARGLSQGLRRGSALLRVGLQAVEARGAGAALKRGIAAGARRVLETSRLRVARDAGAGLVDLPGEAAVHPIWPGRRPLGIPHLAERGAVIALDASERHSLTAALAEAWRVELRPPAALREALAEQRPVVVATAGHAVAVARTVGAPIIPLTVAARPAAGAALTPDAPLLALPYGEVLVLYGRAFALPADASPEYADEVRADVELELERLAELADAMV